MKTVKIKNKMVLSVIMGTAMAMSVCSISKAQNNYTREWGTFYGGPDPTEHGIDPEENDLITDIVADTQGNVYVVGHSGSRVGIVPNGGPNNQLKGSVDGLIAKFNSNGNLIWAYYVGGNAPFIAPYYRENFTAVAYNIKERVLYVTGYTPFSDFPVTGGVHLQQYQGKYDVVLLKINPIDGSLIWSTFYGGRENEMPKDVTVGPDDHPVIVGITTSPSGIAHGNSPYQSTMSSSDDHMFIAKFNSQTGQIIWGTYADKIFTDYSNWNYDSKNHDDDIQVDCDKSGNIYVVGTTSVTSLGKNSVYGNVQMINFSGHADGFLAKFSSDGQEKIYFTYIGGKLLDSANSIKVVEEVQGDPIVVIAGSSIVSKTYGENSWLREDNLAQGDVHMQEPMTSATVNGYIALYRGLDGRRIRGTFIGGSKEDYACRIDANERRIYVVGETISPGLATPGAHSHYVTDIDFGAFYMSVFYWDLKLEHYTYYPGDTNYPIPVDISLHPKGEALYFSNNVLSRPFPPEISTFGAHQELHSFLIYPSAVVSLDGVLVKFNIGTTNRCADFRAVLASDGFSLRTYVYPRNTDYIYTLLDENEQPIHGQTNTTGVFTNIPLETTYKVRVDNLSTGCSTLSQNEFYDPCIAVRMNIDVSVPRKGEIIARGSGGQMPYTYKLYDENYQIIEGQVNNTGFFTNLPVGKYYVDVFDANGCQIMSNLIDFSDQDPCENTDLQIRASTSTPWHTITSIYSGGTPSYTFKLFNVENSTEPLQSNTTGIFSNLVEGTYTVKIQDMNGCTAISEPIRIISPCIGLNMEVTKDDRVENNITISNITIKPSGGTGPYRVSIDGQGGQSGDGPFAFTRMLAGSYDVILTDANGCLKKSTITVVDLCEGLSTRAYGVQRLENGIVLEDIVIIPSGGKAPYRSSVEGQPEQTGDGPFTFRGLPPGSYNTVILTDFNGCVIKPTVRINDLCSQLKASVLVTHRFERNLILPRVYVSVEGGVAPYRVVVGDAPEQTGPGTSSFVFDNLGIGTHEVVVTDARGCRYKTTATINDVCPQVTVNVGSEMNEQGKPSLVLTVNVEGGRPEYQVILMDENGNEIQVKRGSDRQFEFKSDGGVSIRPGKYEIVVRDQLRCMRRIPVEVP